MTAEVEARELIKSYGSRPALRGLSLTVSAGQVVALLGPNGSGKTTTLRSIAGLIRPERGELRVFGIDPWHMPREARLRVGYLPETPFPFPSMTLKEAARFTARFYPTWEEGLVRELVSILEVPTDVPCGSLSYGEQCKFSLLLVLAPKPDLVLLDDPGQGLDVISRRQIIDSIHPLLEQNGCSVLFSSHIFSDVERIADEIAFLDSGKVVLQRPVDELKERSHRLVFRGEIPVFPGIELRRREARGEIQVTVCDLPSSDLDSLRSAEAFLEARPLPLEDLFVEIVKSREKGVENERA